VTLRHRLLLSLVLTMVPLAVGAIWLRYRVDRRAGEQAFGDLVVERVEAWGREACEADPGRPPGRGRGRFRRIGPDGFPPGVLGDERIPFREGRRPRWSPRFPFRMFSYDAGYRPADPSAPPFPPALRRALEGGETLASTDTAGVGGERHVLVALRTGWDSGPCALVLARGIQPIPGPPLPGLLASVGALAGAFLVAVWIAAGPVVRRIRELTAAVSRSSATRYERPVPVTGDDEIGELARAFNGAATQIREHVGRVEARERTLRSFVADTTHDVMLPLTVLQGHLAALRRAAQDGRCDAEAVQAASEEAHYLASLVHNLGAAAKLEAGEPYVESHPVNLNELVERVADRHRPVAGPRAIEVNSAVPDPPLWTSGDVTLIEQAVSNVVHNAVRYNRPGGHVAIVLEPGGAGRFRLRVLDDGPGVPESELGRLSERRYRTDEARSRHAGGQGLGLSITREVAERHGFAMRIGRSEAGGLEVELSGASGAPGAPASTAREPEHRA